MATQPIVGSFSATVALDNHTPTRNVANVAATIHAADPDSGRPQTVRLAAHGLKDMHRAVYLLDDGQTIRPHYVAGWANTDPRSDVTTTLDVVYLHPFPTSTGTRPDNGRPVDMSTWALGPRRAYHVKLHDVSGEW